MQEVQLSKILNPSKCPICGGKVVYKNARDIKFNSESGWCYLCLKCHAAVATHKSRPKEAIATLADKKTKNMRIKCHKLFDNIWHKPYERDRAYKELSKRLNIPPEMCHFGYMDYDTLCNVYSTILEMWRNKYDR